MRPKDLAGRIVDAVDTFGSVEGFASEVIDLGVGLGDHVGHVDSICDDRWAGVSAG